jgi:UPF0176 protein
MSIVVSAFYKFVGIAEPARLREELLARMSVLGMKGSILLAPEGINGTVSASPDAMADFHLVLKNDPRFADIVTKDAQAAQHPFKRLKVKLKREIVPIRAPEADPVLRVGTYVEPAAWNALLRDPDVVLLDTRNVYEVAEGTFEGAIDPGLAHFTQWPAYVQANLNPARHKKIAMFCTGGIRCEKASAYMLAHGFEQVYHLKGGILNYLAKVAEADSLWRGRCFVFDERGSVDADDAGSGER